MGLQAYLYEQLYPNRSPDYGGGDLTRFADDMIITARSRAQAELILELLEQFLAARGLKLNWDKTYISKVSMGFEFLSPVVSARGQRPGGAALGSGGQKI